MSCGCRKGGGGERKNDKAATCMRFRYVCSLARSDYGCSTPEWMYLSCIVEEPGAVYSLAAFTVVRVRLLTSPSVMLPFAILGCIEGAM